MKKSEFTLQALAAYNNGKLHGVWIDAAQELDDIQDQIPEHLAFYIDYERMGRGMEFGGLLFIEYGYLKYPNRD